MMKQIVLFALLLFASGQMMAQEPSITIDDLKAEKAATQAIVDSLTGVVNGLDKQIQEFPGWKFGAFGTVGATISQFSEWYGRDNPNVDAGNIGITMNTFANLDREKFFWRNGGQVNVGWVKFDNKDDDTDSDDFEAATDVFNLTSLYGYKLTPKLAASALGEYRTTLLSNFNDPGYLDIGVGLTWTPITNLIVVAHPLNYNFIFSDGSSEFESSLGAKVVADYTRQLPKGISWSSRLSSFISYEDAENLSNYTWTNSFGYQLFKYIGLGFEFGIRSNKQEAFNYQKNVLGNDVTLENVDNDLQTYWLIGASYSF